MSRIAYVDGRYVPHAEAAVHVEDRGYQFSDGVYEVVAVAGGRLIDEIPHLDRLDRSLGELRIAQPMGRPALRHVIREVVRRNRLRDGIVYLQVTRGVARRDHAFPARAEPTLVLTARRARPLPAETIERGVKVVTVPDIRWQRRDIKSVSLLPNVLGKQQAKEAGAYEAWMVEPDGHVTEGTASNAWIVTREGEIVTRQASEAILNGVTRRSVLARAREMGLKLVERPFTVAEAKAAAEAFITSTTSAVLPVVRIDEARIGEGVPGQVARSLRAAYLEAMAAPQ